MRRTIWPLVSVLIGLAVVSARGPLRAADPEPPTTYELVINGESFRVEIDRMSKLKSQEKPGTAYDVALRIAPQQRVELNSVAFEYTWPCKVDDDHARPRRTVRIRHELGYFILLTDLGGPLVAGTEDKALAIVRDSVTESLKESGMTLREAEKPHVRKFAGSSGQGVVLHFVNSEGLEKTCLVYLLTSNSFAVTCVAQYFDANASVALEQIKRTLNSVRALR